MKVRCPNCNATGKYEEFSSTQELVCSACGQQFWLVSDETQTYSPQAEKMIGHFQLLEAVGRGAYGIVYRALDTELDRIVAIKLPRNSAMGAEDANQFLREAQAAAQLKHPNIVSVHEVGCLNDLIYIVSDFIDGINLAQWLMDNRPSAREAAKLGLTIVDALGHAHQAGVVHRDLKPGNILIDSLGSPNIADFGLAKRQIGEMTVTFEEQIVGTPAYMSPEQALGEPADSRSDIYSMGVILFELLTGERPFRGNHQMLMQQVINDPPPSPRKFNATIPRDLETICLKCLEKSPFRRYTDAQKLADDLELFLAGEPIRARPIRTWERVWKWAARRPQVASLLAALVLVVVVGVSVVVWQLQEVLASQYRQALTQLELIRNAEPSSVESAFSGLTELRDWADPELQKLTADDTLPPRDRLRCHLALIENQPDRAEAVIELLLHETDHAALDFEELALGAKMLVKVDRLPKTQLIEFASDEVQQKALRFRALFLLAGSPHLSTEEKTTWQKLSPFVVREFVSRATRSPEDYATLVEGFRPVRLLLLPTFRDFLMSETPDANERFTAASIAGQYAADRPKYLCDLLLELQPEQYRVILPRLQRHREFVNAEFSELLTNAPPENEKRETLVARKAMAAVTLLHLEESPKGIWPLLRQTPDMNLRTAMIHACARFGLPPEKLIARLATETNPSVRSALLLTLGEYDHLSAALRNQLRPQLEDLYRQDPDAGVHAAVAWLLRSWGEEKRVEAMDREPTFHVPLVDGVPKFEGPLKDRKWYVNSQGSTMVVIDHPPVYLMGPVEGELHAREAFDRPHLRKVNRKIAIASTEVSWEQFEWFVKEFPESNWKQPSEYAVNERSPAVQVSWIQAAKYCRWLSEEEGIPEDQMCFPPVDEIRDDMELPDDLMERTGYRLPTEGEWECVCRAGTITRRFFGDSDLYLDDYAWHIGNSNDYVWPCGQLKPNEHGLFDVYGNAWEWCLDRHGALPIRPPGIAYLDAPKLVGSKPRVLRGGSMNTRPDAIHSALRDFLDARHNRNHNIGFRIVRTLPRN